MELKEAKEKIKIESADPVVNAWVLEHLRKDDDCFGKNFKDTHPECQVCDILASIDGRKEPVKVFCKELSEGLISEIVVPLTESVTIGHDEMVDMPPASDNWKEKAKALVLQGLPKEEIIKAMSSVPGVDLSRLKIVVHCYIQNEKKRKK